MDPSQFADGGFGGSGGYSSSATGGNIGATNFGGFGGINFGQQQAGNNNTLILVGIAIVIFLLIR